jgi:glycosyltransferase involved in cell wall biosynthesis
MTYDGLLDPLGGSQILPYLRGVARHHGPVHVLSFEKANRLAQCPEDFEAGLQRDGLRWTPLPFTTRFGKAGKAFDLARMHATAVALQQRHRFTTIHCRSYQAMQVGALLGRWPGVRTLFDMRGLWVDERLDGGLWNLDRLVDRRLYRHYKRVERRLLERASHIISLSHAAVPELQRLAPQLRAPVTVIPCCADFEHFVPRTGQQRAEARQRLGVPPKALLLSYLGSLGTWYLLDDMLRFFGAAAERRADAHFLLITKDWNESASARLQALGLERLRSRIHIQPASRDEVPGFLGASDVMLSFIKPAYSKLASSPTKLAEAWALGVPALSNTGIGDVDALTSELKAGGIVDLARQASVHDAVEQLDAVAALGGPGLRERARAVLGLEVAHSRYAQAYAEMDRSR